MSDTLSSSATVYPITLADAKTQLNVSSTFDDDLIANMIAAATQYAENITNRRFCTETRVLKMDGFEDPRYVHDRQIYLPKSPLLTVSSIKYTASDGTANTTLSTTKYTVSAGDIPGRIFEAYNNTWPTPQSIPNSVTVTYTVGYGSTQAVVPPNVRHAIRLMVADHYRNRGDEPVSADVNRAAMDLLAYEMVPDYG